MKAYLELARPLNVCIGILGVLTGALVAAGTDLFSDGLALVGGLIVVATFMSAGNAINDYTDRENDRENHPGRPIPSGRVSPRGALTFAGALWIVCIAVALTLPFLAVLIALTAAILMLLYDLGLKHAGFPGNVVISLLVGLLFLYGGAVVGDPLPTMTLFLLAFLVTAAREIIKDIEDMEGDQDRDTLPKAIGAGRARSMAAGMVVTAVALSPLPVIFGLLGPVYLPLVLVADAMFIYSLTRFATPSRASWLLKVSMVVGLIAFISGGVIT